MAPSLFTPDARLDHPYWWDEAPPASLPESPLPERADVAVIGAGYTGLSAALSLAEAGRDVVVLEAGEPGCGASTRNHGQVSTKLRRGLAELTAQYGRARAVDITREPLRARDFVADLIEREQIRCGFRMAGRFTGAHTPAAYEKLAAEVEPMTREVGLDCHMLSRAEQRAEVGTDAYHGGIFIPQSAIMQPALWHRGLLERAMARGARVLPRTPVAAVQADGRAFRITTPRGTMSARNVFVATNGYTGGAVHDLRRRVIPIGSYIIATEPLPPALAAGLLPRGRGAGDTRRLIQYYRLSPDGTRMIWGGRVAAGETSARYSAPLLHEAMCRIFPQLTAVRIQYAWMGFVAFTFDYLPHLGERDGIHYSMGYCGSGAAMGPYLGHKAAMKILGREKDGRTALDGLPFETRPLYSGSPWFLGGAVVWQRFLDRMGL